MPAPVATMPARAICSITCPICAPKVSRRPISRVRWGGGLIHSQSNSGDQERKVPAFQSPQGEYDIHTPPNSFLEHTYLLESDEFAYAPIEQLILNQFRVIAVGARAEH